LQYLHNTKHKTSPMT